MALTIEQSRAVALLIEELNDLLTDKNFVKVAGDKRLAKVTSMRNLAMRIDPTYVPLHKVKEMLDGMSSLRALFWFIENIHQDHPQRDDLFFYCRERIRKES